MLPLGKLHEKLFLHHRIYKLEWFLLFDPYILYGENLYSLQLLCTSLIRLKYTAILFPLVSYANITCGLFLHHFFSKIGVSFLLLALYILFGENSFSL